MAAAFGDTPHVNLEILIGQLVNLVKDGQPVRMSKRAGTVVTLEDLVDAVGVDAARYALARSSVDAQIDIDLDLLVSRTQRQPGLLRAVRARPARRHRAQRGRGRRPDARTPSSPPCSTTRPTRPCSPRSASSPASWRQAAELREPHRVARYLEELAGTFHKWYESTRVTPRAEEPVTDAHRTRLWLAEAARQVIENGLGLLGVSAPDRM